MWFVGTPHHQVQPYVRVSQGDEALEDQASLEAPIDRSHPGKSEADLAGCVSR
jgi:hypothetical protein